MLDARIRNLDEFRNYRHPLESTFLLFYLSSFPAFPKKIFPCSDFSRFPLSLLLYQRTIIILQEV